MASGKKRDKPSYSHNNRIALYPHPRIKNMFVAYCFSLLEHKSTVAEDIFKNFFDKTFNEDQRQRLLKLYESMSPEQRKNPACTNNLKDNL